MTTLTANPPAGALATRDNETDHTARDRGG